MKDEHKTSAIGNALIWAAAILAMSLLLKDSERSAEVLIILVASWYGTTLFGNAGKYQEQSKFCSHFKHGKNS